MREKKGYYITWDKLDDLLFEDLENYYDRKNKLVIVKFKGGERCLVFLVSDCEKPQVPGYPACGIEYFDNHELAVKEIKRKLAELNYMPKYQEFGFFS